MRKNKICLLAVAAVGVLTYLQYQPLSAGESTKGPAKTPVVQETKSGLLNSKTPVLVDFWADWCAPCRVTGPIVDRIEETFDKKLAVVRVEADKNPGLSRTFNVQYLPTLVLIQNGKVVRRWEGSVSEESLRVEIDKALAAKKPA